jgi:hypothetical protein
VNAVVKCKARLFLFPPYPWPVVVGTSVPYVAFVPVIIGSGSLTGTVTFYVDGAAVSSCKVLSLNHHFAYCNINFPNAGSFTVTATYSGDPTFPSASDSSVQIVNKGATGLELAPSSLVGAGAKVTYTATVSETWGSGPLAGTVSFSEDGTVIPACKNLSLSGASATCMVSFPTSGVFTIAASYAGDPNFDGSSATISQVVGSTPLSITTTSLVDASQGEVGYSQTLAGTGGTTPYSWTISAGSLPAGLTLKGSTGVISGTVSTSAKTQTFTVTLSDARGATTTKSFSITVKFKPVFTCGDSARGSGGHSFSFQLTATGVPDPSFSESGKLPAGLSFDAATGVLSGTPPSGTSGTWDVTFTATNSVGSTSLAFTLQF